MPALPPTPHQPIGLEPPDYLYSEGQQADGSKRPEMATPSGPGFAHTTSVISRPTAKIRSLR